MKAALYEFNRILFVLTRKIIRNRQADRVFNSLLHHSRRFFNKKSDKYCKT